MRSQLITKLEQFGDRPAVIHRGDTYSYRELVAEIRRIEEQLAAGGVRPHEVVVLNADFSFRSVAAFLALYLGRNVVVPVVTFTEGTHATVTGSCHPRHLLKPDGNDGRGDLTIEPMAGDAAEAEAAYRPLIEAGAAGLVLLSSGSTGAPKAILHNLDSLVEEKVGTRTRVGAKAQNILMFLLFDHIGGINSLLGVLKVGGTAVVPEKRTPDEICALVESYGIRLLPTSPTFLNLVLIGGYPEKFDLSGLRLITYGTEPMPEELLKRVHAAFPRARLLQTFGTSETGISTTTSESSSSTYFQISDEKVQYRVVEGELQLKSPTQFLGYLNYPSDSLTEDGWFRTGDLVEENAEGYLKVRGRAKEIINVGGEKVLPLELESLLLGSPLIADCVVYGKPNSITGQSVCVDIQPVGALSRTEARKHVHEFLDGKVEPFKIPSKVQVVEELSVSERFKKRRILP
ncbi:long-chain fatty acid--CoA ligase [Streptomyces tateyamensis]|uniref:Long-chain fatty acid--CoA ligase n=1 Tax=Streptomyces tateyamensis TaxID=565073 RepID=A0A2V4NN99_9ACTN|nr:class I adenylate-forming enzyme family protein [Streptomyces tateyamensis]PYC87704.1 long-chain fatty acid--CoA ligase [Streptomyces tateyamensis]